jgi:hypothetical protein
MRAWYRFVLFVPPAVAMTVATTACGSGVKLKDSNVPQGAALPETPSDIQVFSTDDTFKFTPEYWLGSVGVVRKAGGQCGDMRGAKFEWTDITMRNDPPEGGGSASGSGTTTPPTNPDDFAQTLGYPLSPKRTEPELRLQSIVTRQVAAQTSALTFFAADLSTDVVAEIALTDIAVQRAKPTRQFDLAVKALKDGHKSDLIEAADVCYMFVVMGYTEKTLLRKYHSKTTAKSGGGFSGVSVAGSYYASDQDYKFDYIFGLSVRVLKRPTEVPTAPMPPTPKDAADIQQQLNAAKKPPLPSSKVNLMNKYLKTI